MKCVSCGDEIDIGDWPFCKGVGSHVKSNLNVIGDDIPGGIEIRNGVCWPDGTPRRFYSKSEIRKEAFAKNLTMGYETPKPNQRIVEQQQMRKEQRDSNEGNSRLRSRGAFKPTT